MNRADRDVGELRDDVFWHEVVDDLGLGPVAEETTQATDDRRARWRPLVYVGAVLLAAAVFVGVKAALRIAGQELPGDDVLSFWLALAHLLVVGVVLVMILSAAPVASPKVPVARGAWRQFKLGWTWLWVGWIALYGWLAVKFGVTGAGETWERFASCVADVLNIASSFVFFYLFLVLDKPSVRALGDPERDRDFRRSVTAVLVLSGTVALLSVLGRLGLFELQEDGPLLGSVFSAVAMAFFVGRLSDSHLKVRRALLAPLYLYVAIQMFWHLFVAVGAAGESGFGVVLGLALLLKIYLFAVITRWMGDGKLQTYFDEVAFPRLPTDLE